MGTRNQQDGADEPLLKHFFILISTGVGPRRLLSISRWLRQRFQQNATMYSTVDCTSKKGSEFSDRASGCLSFGLCLALGCPLRLWGDRALSFPCLFGFGSLLLEDSLDVCQNVLGSFDIISEFVNVLAELVGECLRVLILCCRDQFGAAWGAGRSGLMIVRGQSEDFKHISGHTAVDGITCLEMKYIQSV